MAVQQLSDHELDQLAAKLIESLPAFDGEEERIAFAVHHHLAEGEPVPVSRIEEATGFASDRITRALDSWPGFVFRDERGDITGFWGFSVEPLSQHKIDVDGRQLWAWCSWDTLFLPVVLGREARIESVCAATGDPVRVVAGPEGVRDVTPAGAVSSGLRPEGLKGVAEDVLSFCHRVLFFASEQAGEQWIADRDHQFLHTLDQGFELGRRVWEAKYANALSSRRAAA